MHTVAAVAAVARNAEAEVEKNTRGQQKQKNIMGRGRKHTHVERKRVGLRREERRDDHQLLRRR